MTDTPTTNPDASIGEKTERLEEIIDQLEAGEVSLERAQELHDEGQHLLQELEEELDLGNGNIIERTT